MKSFLILFVVFALLTSQVIAQNLSIENGTLKFSSLDVYEQFAENRLDRNEITKTTADIKTLGQTETEALENESIYPDFLQMILNSDKIVTLGKFLVKIDLENHQALAIDATNINAYQTLVSNNTTGDGIMVFSEETDNAMDVLEGIENGTLSVKDYQSALTQSEGLFRNCRGADRKIAKSNPVEVWDKAIDKESDCPDQSVLYGMDNKAVYQKFIFFFSLQSKIKSVRACSSTNWFLVPTHEALLKLKASAKFIKVNHCNDEINVIQSDATQGIVLSWRAYQGSRALRKYDFNVDFGIKHTFETGDYHPSVHYRIVYGY